MNNENNNFNTNDTQGFNPNTPQMNNPVNGFGPAPMGTPEPTNPVNEFGPAPMSTPEPTNPVNNYGPTPVGPTEPPKKKSNVLLIIVIVAIVLAIGVGVAVYFVVSTAKKTINVYENTINEKINNTDTTTTTDVGTTDTSNTITHKGYIFKKEPGYTYAESNGTLTLVGTSEIYSLTVTNIVFESIPADQLKTKLQGSGYTLLDFKKTTYNGYNVITAKIIYQGITMVYGLTASSDGLNTMQIMGTTKSGVPASGMLEKGFGFLKAAKYTGSSSSFESDTEINPDFSVLLNVE